MVTFMELNQMNLMTVREFSVGTYLMDDLPERPLIHWELLAKKDGFEGLKIKTRESTIEYKIFGDENGS